MDNKDLLAVIKRHWQTPPVDVFRIIREAGIELVISNLPDHLSGLVERRTDGGWRIAVNAAHSPARQRFTAAHELGHLMYHRDIIGSGVDDDRAYRSTAGGLYYNTNIGSSQETQANRFAANLLMPKHLVEGLQKSVGGLISPRELAQRLGVSEQAMRIQLGLPSDAEQYELEEDEQEPLWDDPTFHR